MEDDEFLKWLKRRRVEIKENSKKDAFFKPILHFHDQYAEQYIILKEKGIFVSEELFERLKSEYELVKHNGFPNKLGDIVKEIISRYGGNKDG